MTGLNLHWMASSGPWCFFPCEGRGGGSTDWVWKVCHGYMVGAKDGFFPWHFHGWIYCSIFFPCWQTANDLFWLMLRIYVYIYIQNMYANSDVLSIFSGSTSQKSIDSMLSGNARRDARYPWKRAWECTGITIISRGAIALRPSWQTCQDKTHQLLKTFLPRSIPSQTWTRRTSIETDLRLNIGKACCLGMNSVVCHWSWAWFFDVRFNAQDLWKMS